MLTSSNSHGHLVTCHLLHATSLGKVPSPVARALAMLAGGDFSALGKKRITTISSFVNELDKQRGLGNWKVFWDSESYLQRGVRELLTPWPSPKILEMNGAKTINEISEVK